MSVTGDSGAPSSDDEVLGVALRLLEALRDEGAIVFTSELDCVGWYNAQRRHTFSRIDMSRWADVGWERVFCYRPCPDGMREVLERLDTRMSEAHERAGDTPSQRTGEHPRSSSSSNW
jgi:hypothetical protein